jgi:N-hydroxyarylamine O-acetyltransferase
MSSLDPLAVDSFTPDLKAYFARIGIERPSVPDLDGLNRIIEAHVRTIPFENLDILLGKGVSVQPERIERKLVHERRGGYCFEQNDLLLRVLTGLGYEATPISARVRFQKPRSFVAARTHLFLRVELDGETWMADVGVGGLSPTCALRLELDTPQTTPHETRRIIAEGDWSGFEQRSPDALLYHQVLLGDVWEDVCEFTLEVMHPIDRELGNWFTSAHPESHFMNRLTVARSTEAGRVTLLNREFKIRTGSDEVTTRTLHEDEEIIDVLAEHFDLRLPAGTRFKASELDV